MKKILIILILLIAAAFVIINLFGAALLGPVLTKAVGAPVSVGRVQINVFSSALGVYNLKIKNPPGFKEKTLAEIHEMSIRYVFPDFFKGEIHIKRIRLDFGDITIEKNGSKVNLLEIGAVKGLTQGSKGGKGGGTTGGGGETKRAPSKPKPAGKAPELLIDEVLVNIGKTRYVDKGTEPPINKEYDLGIHNEVFRNVTKPSSLVKDISYLILRKLGLSSLSSNFDILMKGVGGGLSSTFEKMLKS